MNSNDSSWFPMTPYNKVTASRKLRSLPDSNDYIKRMFDIFSKAGTYYLVIEYSNK